MDTQLIANIVMAACAAIGVVTTGLLIMLNWRLVNETRRLREIQTEPELDVYIIPNQRYINIVELVVRNSGGPAANVKWSINIDEAVASEKGLKIREVAMFSKAGYIPAREKFVFFLGNAMELLKKPVLPVFTIRVEYDNYLGKNKTKKEFHIDVSQWEGLIVIGKDPACEIADNLKQLSQTIDKISRANPTPLLFRVQSETSFQKEQDKRKKEVVEQFEKQQRMS